MLLSNCIGMWNVLPPEPKEVYEVLCFLLSSGSYNCNNLSLTLEGNVLVYPDHWTSKHFTDVVG